MRRVLLDTNIYGLIVEKREEEEFKELLNKARATVYGCQAIRKELRDTPRNKRLLTNTGIRNLRIGLLGLYDTITKEHEVIADGKTQALTQKYLKRFCELTGQTAIDHLKIDFLLVACATLNNLDLIISDDHKTLMSSAASKAYNFVNGLEGLKLPTMLTYEDTKVFLKRLSPL